MQHVFLLRGIGPATHRIMTMTALALACAAQGLPGTRSVLATGNLVVPSDLPTGEVEQRFAAAMDMGGLGVTWLRRSGAQIRATVAAAAGLSAFAEALAERPSKVQIHFLPGAVTDSALDTLRAFAPDAAIARAGDEVIIDYGPMISQSPLTLPRVDRALGSAQTARNWNTVGKIMALT